MNQSSTLVSSKLALCRRLLLRRVPELHHHLLAGKHDRDPVSSRATRQAREKFEGTYFPRVLSVEQPDDSPRCSLDPALAPVVDIGRRLELALGDPLGKSLFALAEAGDVIWREIPGVSEGEEGNRTRQIGVGGGTNQE